MPTYTASEWSRSASGVTRKFKNYVTYTWEPNYSATQSRLIITAAGIVKTSGAQTEIVKGSTSSVKIVCNGVTKTYSTTAKKELDSAAPQYWNLKGTAANYVFYINKTTAQRSITVSVSGGITKPSAWYGTSSGSFTLTQPSSIFYNVTYDANGGTGAPANQIKYNNTALTLSSVIPTKPKYDFLYWNGDDGNTYQPSSVVPASYNDDLALTAEWRESYIAPEFSQMIAYRVDNDATGSNPSVSNSSTRGFVKFILQRGSGYDLDRITVKFGSSSTQTIPSSQIVIGQTQTTVYAYSNAGECPSASTTNIVATVYVTDRASTQRTTTNTTYISPEKILVDYAPDAVGFGCSATDNPSANGNFDCALDAKFLGNLNGYPSKHIGASLHIKGKSTNPATLTLSSTVGGTYPLDGNRYEINTYGTTANYEEVFDLDAHGVITTKEAGIYLINAHFYFTDNYTANDILHGFISINNSSNLGWNEVIYRTTATSPWHSVGLSFVYPLPADIPLTLRMYNQTAARGRTTVNSNISLMVTRIGNIDGNQDILAYV